MHHVNDAIITVLLTRMDAIDNTAKNPNFRKVGVQAVREEDDKLPRF